MSSNCPNDRLDNEGSRARKALKILAILRSVRGVRLAQDVCVDIGCHAGLITRELAPSVRCIIGLEHDAQAIRRASRQTHERLGFVHADALRLPFGDGTVSLVVCAQVYEHVADAHRLLSEIWRILEPGGVCFLSGPNRLYPVEQHYRLPFIHWLPQQVADRLVRALRRAEGYDVHPLTFWGLRSHMDGFAIEDYGVRLLRDPETYGCEDELGRFRWVGRLPTAVLTALRPLLPNFNWVLTKGEARVA